MAFVSEILASKGAQVHTIGPDATVHEAVAKMVENRIGSLLVIDAGAIAGIFTERDCLRRVTLEDRGPRATRVRDVMTSNLICVEPARTLEECMAIMTQEHIRHLPVMDGPRIVGMISVGDLIKHASREQEVHIRFLTEYISGQRS